MLPLPEKEKRKKENMREKGIEIELSDPEPEATILPGKEKKKKEKNREKGKETVLSEPEPEATMLPEKEKKKKKKGKEIELSEQELEAMPEKEKKKKKKEKNREKGKETVLSEPEPEAILPEKEKMKKEKKETEATMLPVKGEKRKRKDDSAETPPKKKSKQKDYSETPPPRKRKERDDTEATTKKKKRTEKRTNDALLESDAEAMADDALLEGDTTADDALLEGDATADDALLEGDATADDALLEDATAGITSQHHMMFRAFDGGPKEFRLIRISSSLYEWWAEDISPLFAGKGVPYVAAVCNELFCLMFDSREYVLWNSSTSEYKSIPPLTLDMPACVVHEDADTSSTCTRSVSSTLFGLGFDSASSDFKLVCFTTVKYYDDTACIGVHCVHRQITSVYSLNRNSWKEIPELGFYNLSCISTRSLNGMCYWGPPAHTHLSSKSVVVAFDFSSEHFLPISVPDIPSSFGRSHVLIDFNGSLALVVWMLQGVSQYYRFWILEVEDGVYGWVRKEELDVAGVNGGWQPLGSCRSGGSLLLQGKSGALVEYDYYTRSIKIHEDFSYHPFGMRLVSFVETCVRLNSNETARPKTSTRKKAKEIEIEIGGERR